MTKILSIALWIALCLSTGLQAQSYKGTVCDKGSGKFLEDISVSFLAADSSLISYSYTDRQGHFEMQPASTGRFFLFSSIGYKQLLLPVAQFKDGMTIRLEETALQIREVRITSRRIRQSKDTLTFTVSGFKMPQDRSIEDVLKKIPGIEVTSNGTIKFQDKPISGFYIEGMNLLEEKYALGSKNIPANMVQEIQVLQAHQPIAALRGKSFSDNAALNLTLNDKAKSRLIKVIDLGLGAGNGSGALWDNRLLGMLFGKNMQNLTMYKNNNTGKDIASEIVPLTQTGIINSSDMNGENDFFSQSAAQSTGVDPERYLFNKSHLIVTNHLYRPNAKTDLRLQFNALHSEETANHQSGTTYFYPSQTITIDEAEDYSGQENRAEGHLTYMLNDSDTYIKNTLKGQIGLHKSTLDLTVNRQRTNEYIHPERKFLQNNFELIKNKKSNTLSIYSANTYTELPQYMTVTPGLFTELLNNGKAYDTFKQEAHLKVFSSDSYTYFQHKLAGFYLKYKTGIKYSNKKMTSTVYTDQKPLQKPSLGNDVRLESVRLYIEPSLNYKSEFWEIQASAPIAFLSQRVKYRMPDSRRLTKQRLMPMPELNVKYEMNAYWNSILLSSFSYTAPDIQQLYAGYLFSSYRSASAYEPQLHFDKSWYNMLGVRFNNPLKGFFFSVTGFYNLSRQDIIYGYENSDNYLTLCKAYPRRHNSYLWGARARISKAYPWKKLYTAFSAVYSHNKSHLLLEEEPTVSSLESINLKFNFSLQPSRYANIDGNTSATHTKSALDYAENEAVKTWNYRHELNLNLTLSSHWKARLANTLSHNSRNNAFAYFADASIIFSQRLFDIEIAGRNLLNHTRLDNIYVNSFTEKYTRHTLRPQEFLMKIAFSF